MSVTSEQAPLHFNNGMDLFMEDGRLGLKYILLRLEDELTKEDRANLRDLIACACANKDVSESVDRVRKAQSASQLAVTIARAECHQQEGGRSRCHLWSAWSASDRIWRGRPHKN
jgi:hypothetical protein